MILSTKNILSICLRALAGALFIVALLTLGTDASAEEPDLKALGELEHRPYIDAVGKSGNRWLAYDIFEVLIGE